MQVVNQLHKENVTVDENNIAKIDYSDVFGLGITLDLIQERKKIKSSGYLVITGDRGLVGSYNSSVLKNMMSLFEDSKAENKDVKILAVGSVGAQFFLRKII